MANSAQVSNVDVTQGVEVQAMAAVEPDMNLKGLLDGYVSPSELPDTDMVDGRYRILVNEPIPSLNTKFSDAYAVQDTQGEFTELYVLSPPNHLPLRDKTLEALKTVNVSSLTRCYTAAPTYLSYLQEVRLAIVLQRPSGRRLSEIVRTSGSLSERVIILNVLKPICEALSKLHEKGVNHGCLNPDTIYIGQQVMLSECVCEPSGYSQKYHYEPPERILVPPYGKGSADSSADIYALGVLALYLSRKGRLEPEKLSPEELMDRILEVGPYNAYVKMPDLSVNLLDFCQGVLTEHPHERWSTETAISCLQGKRYNLIPPSPPKDSTRSFTFAQRDLYSKAAIVNAIANDWAEAKLRLDIAGLLRWLERGVGDQELADALSLTLPDPVQFELAPKPIKDIELTRALVLLDPQAPMHIKDISLNIDALGLMMAHSFHEGNHGHIRLLCSLIEQGIPKQVTELLPGDMTDQASRMLWSLQNVKMILGSQTLGMGVERLLYHLNPSLTCQTSYLQPFYLSSVSETLETLDRLAADKMSNYPLLDKHLAAFLTAKMDINKVVRVVELARYSDLSTDKRLVMLKILSQAQQKVGNPPLKGLSAWALDMVMPIVDNVNNQAMRSRLRKEVRKKAETGLLEQIAFSVFNPDTVGKDQDAFSKVTSLCDYHLERIAHYRDEKNLRLQARETGRSMSIGVAYLILLVTIYFSLEPYVYL